MKIFAKEAARLGQATRLQLSQFIERDINPHAEVRDQGHIPLPREVLSELARLGILTYSLPKEIGGGGADPLTWGATLEEIGYLSEDCSLGLLLSLRVAVIRAIYDARQSHLTDRYVPALMRGQIAGCFAYSDGADAFAFRSGARRHQGGYRLNGEKLLITGGATADLFMTYLRDEETQDLQVFIIERGDPGVVLEPIRVNGLRAAGLATLRFQDLQLGPERLLVPADGLSQAQRFLNERRPYVACGFLGRMRAILEKCIGSLLGTSRYGKPLTEMQNVQAVIGRMSATVQICQMTLYHTLGRLGQTADDMDVENLSAVAKHLVTEQAMALVLSAMRLLGGQGYLQEQCYERYLRDFTGLISGAGAQDILEVNLGMTTISEVERTLRRRQKP